MEMKPIFCTQTPGWNAMRNMMRDEAILCEAICLVAYLYGEVEVFHPRMLPLRSIAFIDPFETWYGWPSWK